MPPIKRPVSLPLSSDGWQQIIDRIIPASESGGGSWKLKEARSLHERFLKKERIEAPIHCECALIEYYAKRSRRALGDEANPMPSADKGGFSSDCGTKVVGGEAGKNRRIGKTDAPQSAASSVDPACLSKDQERSLTTTRDTGGTPVGTPTQSTSLVSSQNSAEGMHGQQGIGGQTRGFVPVVDCTQRPGHHTIEDIPKNIQQSRFLDRESLDISESNKGNPEISADSSSPLDASQRSPPIFECEQTIKGISRQIGVKKRPMSAQTASVSKSQANKENKARDVTTEKSAAKQKGGLSKSHERKQPPSRDLVQQKNTLTQSGRLLNSHQTTQGRTEKNSVEETGTPAHSMTISDKWNTVPAFSYLGVSKLSCSACQMWIDGYNHYTCVRFYTKGSHGKWYWPWGHPRFNEARVSTYMVDGISTIYYEHCRAQRRLRRASDGSTAAVNDIPIVVDQEYWDLATALMANTRIGEGFSEQTYY